MTSKIFLRKKKRVYRVPILSLLKNTQFFLYKVFLYPLLEQERSAVFFSHFYIVRTFCISFLSIIMTAILADVSSMALMNPVSGLDLFYCY